MVEDVLSKKDSYLVIKLENFTRLEWAYKQIEIRKKIAAAGLAIVDVHLKPAGKSK